MFRRVSDPLSWLGWVLSVLAVFAFMFGMLLLADPASASDGTVTIVFSVVSGLATLCVLLILVASCLILAGAARIRRREISNDHEVPNPVDRSK